ncbi:MAG: hypothetical protein Q7T59_01060 [Candidatus Woesebacteria bacterium]|nr:hypothetical protein [Candidatus Woesebacteria bacterium]
MSGYHRVHKHASSLRVASRLIPNRIVLAVDNMEEKFIEIQNFEIRCYSNCPIYVNNRCQALGREVFPGLNCEAQRVSRGERE